MAKRGKRSKAKPGEARKKKRLPVIEVSREELMAIVDRAVMAAADREKLKAVIEWLVFLQNAIEAKGASIRHLRKLLFGWPTEKTSRIFPQEPEASSRPADDPEKGPQPEPEESPRPGSEAGREQEGDLRPPKRKGHGRRGAEQYRGAEKVRIAHPSLRHGDPCPECLKGKVYRLKQPARVVRVIGMAPLSATVYELDRLRCKLCGKVFTAPAPQGVGTAKYDEKAVSMIALLKYGCGLPFNRLERLQRELGIPLAAGTQWELVQEAATLIKPAHEELIRQAAQGEVLHNDDTTMRILDLRARGDEEAPRGKRRRRRGAFTSGIVATADGRRIALFFSGCRHAGENLEQVLARRAPEMSPPIQMSDALPANHTRELNTIVAKCLAHARRKFVHVAENFPTECRYVLETLQKIYGYDAVARERKMSPQERLAYHQEKSAPLLKELKEWLETQSEERKVEPNSGLGRAIAYMLKHWTALTRFTLEPGAPLDNNIVERALKRAILHRKNSLFYKTPVGAQVGDLFMSLIHTAELSGIDVFDYLSALQENAADVASNPSAWMPWNYKSAAEVEPANTTA